MAVKFFLVACATALFVNAITACPCGDGSVGYSAASVGNIGGCGGGNGVGLGYGNGIGYGNVIGLGNGIGDGNCYGNGIGTVVPSYVAAGNGGGLGISSASALFPSGISILSENNIDGLLEVSGAVPLLATVAFEGNVPSAGAAGTSYSCGNGNVGISADSLAAAGLAAGNGLAGYGTGLGLGAYGAGNIGYSAGNFGYGAGAGNLGLTGCGCGSGRY